MDNSTFTNNQVLEILHNNSDLLLEFIDNFDSVEEIENLEVKVHYFYLYNLFQCSN